MVFSSHVFLFFFLPITLLLYYISPRKLRNPVLLLVSLFFYGWGEPAYLLLMIFTIVVNFLCGAWVHFLIQKGKRADYAVAAAVVVNMLLLGYFKYAGFLMKSVKSLIPLFGDVKIPEILLPIGISFYIFQSLSYVIDVYRGDAPVQKNLLIFGTYVTLFPQLIAGPIVRYRDVALQMENRKENVNDFASGVLLFICGLSKKVLLANPMGNLWNLAQGEQGSLVAWVGILAYTMQIYFDFSGYSDMARGLGRMLGFEFLENFNYPYISRSITEFWRRWHISLSTWFREYVYIPLGGNRRGMPRQILNLLIVWMLTGLWHGASWNFVLWGLYYALFLIAEKLFLLKSLERMPVLLRRCYTMLVVLLGWSLFYFEDLSGLGSFLARLFSLESATVSGLNLISAHLPLLFAACLASTPVVRDALIKAEDKVWVRWGRMLASAAALILCIASLASESYNPFIYFRF